MEIRVFQVDAFTDRPFAGNPAAVCPLDSWISDELMQQIAAENNLSETAFFVPEGDEFGLRWFTPEVEVDLCGHATLASAWVLVKELGFADEEIRFNTRSGLLTVRPAGDRLEMTLPSIAPDDCAANEIINQGLGLVPKRLLRASNGNYVVVLENEAEVRNLMPDFVKLKELGRSGVVPTALADSAEIDYVSRFFGPGVGINEDPVTGSAHASLAPFWANELGKTALVARQISARGGELACRCAGSEVFIQGDAVTVLEGKMKLQDF